MKGQRQRRTSMARHVHKTGLLIDLKLAAEVGDWAEVKSIADELLKAERAENAGEQVEWNTEDH